MSRDSGTRFWPLILSKLACTVTFEEAESFLEPSDTLLPLRILNLNIHEIDTSTRLECLTSSIADTYPSLECLELRLSGRLTPVDLTGMAPLLDCTNLIGL